MARVRQNGRDRVLSVVWRSIAVASRLVSPSLAGSASPGDDGDAATPGGALAMPQYGVWAADLW
jgi:hypothetical protein